MSPANRNAIPEDYMRRCLELAAIAAGHVAPNPLVGAVLVHGDRIIGEGYHQQYGGPHAEPNCISSVRDEDRQLISSSTLYVSLEPCAHFGKTPPCADLIIHHRIPKVVIGCRDPFPAVNGKGIEKLLEAGIACETGVLEKECMDINRRFFTFHAKQRPYIILKWAQTSDRRIGSSNDRRLLISNEYSNRLVHRWRSEEAAILVGTNTAIADDPELTTRLWKGPSPVRMVIDLDLKLPATARLFNDRARTTVFNRHQHQETDDISYYQVTRDSSIVHQVLNAAFRQNLQSILVEGGAMLLQSFIDEGLWDEARIITNNELNAGTGLPAPELSNAIVQEEWEMGSDRVAIYRKKN